MTKNEAYRKLTENGLGYTANVVMCHCDRPAKKLVALASMASQGIEIRHHQFHIDQIWIGQDLFSLGQIEEVGAVYA